MDDDDFYDYEQYGQYKINHQAPLQIDKIRQQHQQKRVSSVVPSFSSKGLKNKFSPSFKEKEQTKHKKQIFEEKKCYYCGESEGVVKCVCGKYICNGPVSNCGDCQILVHIKNCRHYTFSCGGHNIECCRCGDTNIFDLLFRLGDPKFYCSDCLKENERFLYSEHVAKQGVFSLNNLDQTQTIGTSVHVVSLDVVNAIDDVVENTFVEARVRNKYLSPSEYCSVYKTLVNYENQQQSWEEYVIKTEINFINENDRVFAVISRKKHQKMPRSTSKFILCGKGQRGILNLETLDFVILNCATLFSKCDFVVYGEVLSTGPNSAKLQIKENYFQELLPQYFQEVPKYLFGAKESWKTKIFRLYVLTDNCSSEVVTNGLHLFEKRQNTNEYISTILGTVVPKTKEVFSFMDINPPGLKNPVELNASQIAAVLSALNNHLSLVVGPPGTGKTSVAVSIVQHILFYREKIEIQRIEMNTGRDFIPHRGKDISINKKVLVSASSNNAVNVLCERLVDFGISVVRIPADEKYADLSDKVRGVSLLYRAYEYCKHADVDKDGNSLSDIQNLLKKKIDSFFTQQENKEICRIEEEYKESPKLQLMFKDFQKYLSFANNKLYQRKRITLSDTENKTINDFTRINLAEITENYDVIAATLSKAVFKIKFACAVIDESAQSIEPETFSGIMNVQKAVLIGDIQQLPPTVVSNEAKNGGLEKSMFERLLQNGVAYALLTTQYRMHPAISQFPNNNFYNGKLVDGVDEDDRFDERIEGLFPNNEFPVMFVHCKGDEFYGTSGKSYGNDEEKKVVKFMVKKLNEKNIRDDEIGIISPYATQRELLGEEHKTIEVSSVDGFQGNEKPFIIISCVRSNENRGIGFVGDHRRLNVSLTRAKYGLVIIGDAYTLMINPIFKNLMKFLYDKNCFVVAKEVEGKVCVVSEEVPTIEKIKLERSQFQMVYDANEENSSKIEEIEKIIEEKELNEIRKIRKFEPPNLDVSRRCKQPSECVCTNILEKIEEDNIRRNPVVINKEIPFINFLNGGVVTIEIEDCFFKYRFGRICEKEKNVKLDVERNGKLFAVVDLTIKMENTKNYKRINSDIIYNIHVLKRYYNYLVNVDVSVLETLFEKSFGQTKVINKKSTILLVQKEGGLYKNERGDERRDLFILISSVDNNAFLTEEEKVINETLDVEIKKLEKPIEVFRNVYVTVDDLLKEKTYFCTVDGQTIVVDLKRGIQLDKPKQYKLSCDNYRTKTLYLSIVIKDKQNVDMLNGITSKRVFVDNRFEGMTIVGHIKDLEEKYHRAQFVLQKTTKLLLEECGFYLNDTTKSDLIVELILVDKELIDDDQLEQFFVSKIVSY
ncbi:hypothetical protein EIN_312750 [Entamoeba invadens IP1]|uniref:Upf1 domain-containing protein n=1 Tax=Entamoeba invadens IP1 TaxID=370355 RepID=A0A0A1UGP7_ENTIV|nr:hypothetical protein EIN_312750 [Entamoeba invadens IP1]ELP92903.1 hypothetical protein EIN_312750 [Entamoeba invadens IP1]|eukprot:XP_004259674.1 hypothetical protein EIN_312750 [Entamoeba invadens IP1]